MNSKKEGMTLIVKTITRLTVVLIILYALYITFHGHLTPGGGFAGGVILALSFVHIVIAFGKNFTVKNFTGTVSSILESVGALVFLSIAILGFFSGAFFKNFLGKGEIFKLFSGGIILPSNLAIMLKVGFGMFSAFLCLIFFKTKEKDK